MEPGSQKIFSDIKNCGRTANRIANDIRDDHIKLANAREQLKFNMRCKKNKILPKSLKIRPPIRTPGGYRIANKAALHFLNEIISNCHYRIGIYLKNIVQNTTHLAEIIPLDLLERFKTEVVRKHDHIRNLKKHQLIQKFEKLCGDAIPSTYNPDWVINLSSKELSRDEKCVLSKGLDFAATHHEKDKLDFIASVEPSINNLKNTSVTEKESIRQRIVTAIESAPRIDNITVKENEAIKSLRNDDSIVIVSADKGRAAVVMDKVEYEQKITEHLSDKLTYKSVTTNPNNTLQNKVNSELKQLRDFCCLTEEEYKYLRSTTASTPLFYALIKTHKPNNPIRPIISFIDSPTYKLAKHLSKILTPITECSERKLKNSFEMKEFLSHQQIPSGYSIVSFDVKSLFTCIPQECALQACKLALDNYNDLFCLTTLEPKIILKLTKLCLESCTFQWKGSLYKQIKGCPMGSPISVALAELTMQNFEDIALLNPPCSPLFWKRYVDDILTALPTNRIDAFQEYLNNINTNIQFTKEIESENQIPYLDLNITKSETGQLTFDVYRKNSHTNKYMDFNSYNPLTHKISTATSLYKRARTHCSEEFRHREQQKIRESLKLNGYSDNIIKRSYQSSIRTTNNVTTDESKKIKYISVPYIRGTSERVNKILEPHGIKLGHRTTNSIKSKLPSAKDKRTTMERTGVVYCIQCEDCETKYIGETGKELHKRLTEHKNAVHRHDPLSAIYQHIATTGHTMNFDNTTILARHNKPFQRKILEAIHSHNQQHIINRAAILPVQYLPVINSVLK